MLDDIPLAENLNEVTDVPKQVNSGHHGDMYFENYFDSSNSDSDLNTIDEGHASI